MKKYLLLLKRTVIALSLAVLLFEPVQLHAQAIDTEFFSKNDIFFWDPNDCQAGTSGGTASLVGNENAEKIWNYLVGNDGNLNEKDRLTPEQAAGVMGNIKAESGFNPGIEEKTARADKGYGIIQWTFDRRIALEKAAKKEGVKSSDLGFQLTYLFQELNSRDTNRPEYRQFDNEWKMIQGQKSLEDALVAFHHEVEISHLMDKPNPRKAVIDARLPDTKDIYASFKDKVPSGASASGSSTTCGSNEFAGGNFQETLLAYAWPNYEANKTQNMPAYQKAMEKAQKDGQYLGGSVGSQLGVDCGAFVTRLMIDSGYEPGYNYKGKGGNTTVQEKWLRENWKVVGKGNQVKVGGDTSDEKVLRPGDVAIDANHTFVFVGKVEGFDSNTAAASLRDHSPMAGRDPITDARWTWYRKK